MKRILFAIAICTIFLQGCATGKYTGRIWEENGETHFEMNAPGKMVKGDCSIDMQTPSLLRTITEAAIVKGLEARP